MKFGTEPNVFELSFCGEEPPGSPRPGDAMLHVAARTEHFSGDGSFWFSSEALSAFDGGLEHVLAGEARAQLGSLSPGELALAIGPARSRGYLLVEIEISQEWPTAGRLRVVFEVEPAQVVKLSAWLRAHRGPP
jgi:hypothetical protein